MRRTPVGSTIALVLLSTVALSLVVNVASGELPEALLPYRWLSWPLLFLLAGVVITVTLRADSRGAPVPAKGNPERTREVLLAAQHDSWIAEVLEQSLYAKARLRLSLNATIDEPHPWGVRVIAPGKSARRLSGDQSITEIFDGEMRGWMLILGEPGAGKTTTMLELLRDLLGRAKRPGAPVPLMVNLAAWDGSADIAAWAVKEAARRYRVPAAHLRDWLDGADVVLLLDGLDEVAEHRRVHCLRGVNALRLTHPTVPVIVSCRSKEYEALGENLTLRGRVEIQPLTAADVDRFLRKHRLGAARDVLDTAPDLRALVTTPLLLSVLMLAYRDAPTGLSADGDPVERLFTAYVRRMLVQRTAPAHPPHRLLAQLAFIAATMRAESRTIFTFDSLNDRALSRRPGWRNLGYVLAFAAAGWFWTGPGGAALGLFTGVFFFVQPLDRITVADFTYRLDEEGRRRERVASGLFEIVWDGLEDTVDDWVYLITPASLGLATGAFVGFRSTPWTGVWFGAAAFAAALLALALVVGAWSGDPQLRELRSELPSPMAAATRRQGVRLAMLGAVGAFAITLGATVWSAGFAESVRFAGAAALAAACFVFTNHGGGVVTEQRAIRRSLARSGRLDCPARGLLDHAADALLLQRLGADYIFPHLLLRDYFAELWGTVSATRRDPLATSANPDQTYEVDVPGLKPRADRIAVITRGLG